MREHNFQICKTRISKDPSQNLWECKRCDSIVTVPIAASDAGVVNRFMANRFACLEPVESPAGQTIDSRTETVKPGETLESARRRLVKRRNSVISIKDVPNKP